MTDSKADLWLWFALLAWMVSWVNPLLGMLLQFPVTVYLVWKCDVKTLPALLLLMFGKGNLVSGGIDGFTALRFGVTLSNGSVFIFSVFFLTLRNLLQGRYDRPTSMFGFFWLLAFVPASIMSFSARRYNLVGVWSYPIMDFMIPAVYFWAISMGRSYANGGSYLIKRLTILFLLFSFQQLFMLVSVFTFIVLPISFCAGLYYLRSRDWTLRGWKFWGFAGLLVALLALLFARSIAIKTIEGTVGAAEELGSSFSYMTMVAVAIGLSFLLTRRYRLGADLIRMIPIAMVAINVLFVTFVLATQAGDKAKDVVWKKEFDTVEERFTYKLFGDRGTVWKMGWEEMKEPPYVFRDLRAFYDFDPKLGGHVKLLPHNQFITLFARYGYWLGTVLAIFIVWVWVRAFRVLTLMPGERVFSAIFVPAGASIFFIVGITGQSVVSYDLWGNSLATIVFPGIMYGYWVWRRRMRRRQMSYPIGQMGRFG